MSKITLKTQKEMDLEDFKDHMIYAGGLSWSWWASVDFDDEFLTLGYYENLDWNNEVTTKRLTWQEVADACSELAADDKFVANQLANDDFDADGSDRVLQYAFIGEVRYG